MKVLLYTHGTRGDIEPYLALACDLNAAGHDDTLAAPTSFESFITDHGVRFVPRHKGVLHHPRCPGRRGQRRVIPDQTGGMTGRRPRRSGASVRTDCGCVCAVGVDRSKVGLSRPSSADDPRLRGVVSAADALARPVGAAEVWAHHVAAAALVDELLPALVQGALGVDETQL
jgi:hypothetical protein